jgi:hypothetical protein
MHEQLTDDARQAINLVREEVDTLRHNWLGTEHLLLGLLRHEDAFAARALASLGVTLEVARQQVDYLIENKYKVQPEDRKKRALWQAERFGHYYIGTLHLLLGLIQEPDGVAVRALAYFGVEAPDVRRKVMEMLRAGEYREKKRGGLHNFHRKGRKGISIRLELLDDERFARELEDLLVLTDIVEIPDQKRFSPGLPSGERNEPPAAPLDDSLHARIEQVVEQLGMHIEMMREDLLGLERAHRMLFELLDQTEQGKGQAGRSTDD